jgi:hypothetical protein
LPTNIDQRPSTNDHRLSGDQKTYNSGVNFSASPKPAAHDTQHHDKHEHRHSIYAAEASGLLLMAVLLLILTLIRYWQDIYWSVR